MTLVQIDRKAKDEALSIVGGLSAPSKMPGPSYSTSAFDCQTGSKLAKIKGSVCEGCYARKGFYRMPVVQRALKRRLASLQDPKWIESMITLCKGIPYFRFHDSGDIQSVEHLRQIVEVCLGSPDTKFWLPTKEYAYVTAYLKRYTSFPVNLSVRLSAHMVGGKPPTGFGLPVSTVTVDSTPDGAQQCPAPLQGGKCGDCRACWQTEVKWVNYHKH